MMTIKNFKKTCSQCNKVIRETNLPIQLDEEGNPSGWDVLNVFLSDDFQVREEDKCSGCTADGVNWLYENEDADNVIGELVMPDEEIELVDDLPH